MFNTVKVARIMTRLLAEELINVNGTDYVRYMAIGEALGLSTALAQYQRRKAKYPEAFIQINHKPYITLAYAEKIILHWEQEMLNRQNATSNEI